MPTPDESSPPLKRPCSGNNQSDLILPSGKSVSFPKFHLSRVLSDNPEKKVIFLEGKLDDSDDRAIVILEKAPFTEDNALAVISDNPRFHVHLQNDIYNTLDLFPKPQLNGVYRFSFGPFYSSSLAFSLGIKTTLIYPATDKHIAKYIAQDMYLITETSDDYQKITLPFLEKEQFNIQVRMTFFPFEDSRHLVCSGCSTSLRRRQNPSALCLKILILIRASSSFLT
jgi:hypothetical protein